MLEQLVIWASLQLAFAATLSCTLGHRLGRERRVASFLLIQGIAWASWYAQLQVSGSAPPRAVALASSAAVGLAVIALFRRWNPVGHAALGAALLATAAFLAYAGEAIAGAGLDPWTFPIALLMLGLQLGALALLLAHTFEIVDVVCRTEWRPVERHCGRLGPRFRFYHLLPWPGYKAGALNFALSVTARDAAIVGVVDADYLVEPDFLADLVGHFADPSVAFVQTPQDYRDGDTRGRYGRALYLAYLYFFKVSMASRNERNAIIYAGTMGLIRRSALVDVGGWDEWCITEDAEVALRLLDAGHGSVYVDRTYGRGLMPLDVAALRRQRFRWAFGGMQLLRKHARKLLLPRSGGRLTAAQRLLFLSGGLQWLNDPFTFVFSVILLFGAAALCLGRPFRFEPLAGAAILTPLLFIFFAVMRFLWALRVRLRCTWRERADALTILLGLTWVVTQACCRGLVSRRGEFLRTPKQGPRPSLADTIRAVRPEFLLAGVRLVAVGLLAVHADESLLAARGVVMTLLLWQAAIYASAVRSGFWNWLKHRAAPATAGALSVAPNLSRSGRLRLASRAAAACLLGLVATPVRAEAQELTAGWEGGQSRGYAFVSPAVSVGLGAHAALVLRGAASDLYYQLPETGGVTSVASPGASAGLGLRLRAPGLTVTIGSSYEIRRTTRRFAAGASTLATERGLTSQAAAYLLATPLTVLQGIVSYGQANRYLWARASVQRQITNTGFEHPVALAIGAEGTGQGNADVRSYGGGALLALNFLRARASVQLRAGYAQLRYASGSREARPYLGVGAYQAL